MYHIKHIGFKEALFPEEILPEKTDVPWSETEPAGYCPMSEIEEPFIANKYITCYKVKSIWWFNIHTDHLVSHWDNH